jgi:hypothetical protein
MTKNQLPFLFIIEIKQNPTNLFNYFPTLKNSQNQPIGDVSNALKCKIHL